MDVALLNKFGINNNLIKFYQSQGKININDDLVEIVDNSVILNILMSNLNDDNLEEFIISIVDEVTRDYCYLIYYLYTENLKQAKVYLEKIDVTSLNSPYKEVYELYNFILNDEGNDFKIIYEDNKFLKHHIALIKKYIKLKQYKIAEDILDKVLEKENNIELKILKNVLAVLPSKTIYIVDDTDIIDPITLEGLRKIERSLLINLELEDYESFSIDMMNLKYIYQGTNVLSIIDLFLINYRKLLTNYKTVGKTNLMGAFGQLDEIVLGLLKSNDYYRIWDLVIEYYDNSEYSIKLEIYKILIDRIISYNKRNMGFIKKEIDLSTSLDNTLGIISKHNLTSISIEDIYQEEEEEIDLKFNYYKLYEDYLKDKKYKEAKNALNNFKKKMKMINVFVDVEYLIKELDVLIENDNDLDVNKNNANIYFNKAMLDFNNQKYESAIFYFREYNKYVKVENPRILVMIAKCYMKLDSYDRALSYFIEAENKFVYPIDYISIIECLIKLEMFDKVIDYVPKYDYYYPDENPYLYYLLSIAYVNLKEYDLAIDALNTVESINVVHFNVDVPCDIEKDIINKLRNGINVDMYRMTDFINYDLSDDEKKIRKEIEILEKQCNGDLLKKITSDFNDDEYVKDKIDYLFTVLKIFNLNDRTEEVLTLIKFIEDLICSLEIPKNDLNEFNKVLGIYKKNC